MPFRRYGGDIESGGSWPTNRFFLPASLITFFGAVIAYEVGSFAFLGGCFLASVVLVVIGAIFPGDPKPTVKEKIREAHRADVIKHFVYRDTRALKDSLRKYQIYGALPEDLGKIAKSVEDA